MADSRIVTIDGKDYALDALSDAAKTSLTNLRFAEQEIARLRGQLAITETARRVYARGVAQNLPADAEDESSPA